MLRPTSPLRAPDLIPQGKGLSGGIQSDLTGSKPTVDIHKSFDGHLIPDIQHQTQLCQVILISQLYSDRLTIIGKHGKAWRSHCGDRAVVNGPFRQVIARGRVVRTAPRAVALAAPLSATGGRGHLRCYLRLSLTAKLRLKAS